mmetsp:Transcript_25713/g.37729  ORF Transcript_25713/g.37729 Transcript_25713/m.37729 type:complete len:227 (-) Transcript_25713:117-797(-)
MMTQPSTYNDIKAEKGEGIWSYISSLFQTLLTALGLRSKSGTILLLGLDNAGKTTLLHRLRTGGSAQTFPPTDRPDLSDTFQIGNVKFSAWDLGGHEAVRHLWEDYASNNVVDAVLFLIDAADSDRFTEVRDELDALVHDGLASNIENGEDDNSGASCEKVPLAILLNKCDLNEAQPSSVVSEQIGYDEILSSYNGTEKDKLAMFRISVWRGEGYEEAFRWISLFL